MTMIDWFKKVVFENYANFKGRARRSEFWWFTVANIIISIVLNILAMALGSIGGIIAGIYSLAVLVPGMAVGVRRLHDIGKSGWWLAGFYILVAVVYGYMFSTGLMNLSSLSNPMATPDVSAVGSPMLGILGLIMFIAAIILLVWFFKDSQPGTNKWGPNPKENNPQSFDFDQQQFHN